MKVYDIPDMSERQYAAKVVMEYADLSERMLDVVEPERTDEQLNQMNAVSVEYQKRLRELQEWRDTELERIAPVADDHKEERAAFDAAHDAYEGLPRRILEDADGRPMTCALSSAPIWDDEAVLEGGDSVVVLRCLVLEDEDVDGNDVDEEA